MSLSAIMHIPPCMSFLFPCVEKPGEDEPVKLNKLLAELQWEILLIAQHWIDGVTSIIDNI